MRADEQDEDQPNHPPTAVEVARRALILSGVVCRAYLEAYKDEDYRRQTVADLREWFDELSLWPHLEPDEKEILDAPLGAMHRSLYLHGTWYVEGLAILVWALRRGDFPPHDQQVDPIAVTNAMDFLDPRATALLSSPKLRRPTELEACREWFYDVHCTLRGFLNHGGDGHLARWIGKFCKRLRLDQPSVMIDGGLAFEGKTLAEAERRRLQEWESVICERHRAAIWLVGEDVRYTEISVDT